MKPLPSTLDPKESSPHPLEQVGALGGLCPTSPPCTGGVGVQLQGSADRILLSAAPGALSLSCSCWGETAFHKSQALPPWISMDKYPARPCLPSVAPSALAAPQAQPRLCLCSPSSALSTHSSDRWRCPSLAELNKSQGNAGKTPSHSHYLSSATLDLEKPLT